MDLLRFFFSYFGRANRAKFWIGIGVAFAMFAIAKPLHQLAMSTIVPGSEMLFHLSGLVLFLWGLAWLVSMLAIAVRRLHDLGRSGWWVVLLSVPFVGIKILPWAPPAIFGAVFFIGLVWLGSEKGVPEPSPAEEF